MGDLPRRAGLIPDVIAPPAVIRERLACVVREARALRSLLRLSVKAWEQARESEAMRMGGGHPPK